MKIYRIFEVRLENKGFKNRKLRFLVLIFLVMLVGKIIKFF